MSVRLMLTVTGWRWNVYQKMQHLAGVRIGCKKAPLTHSLYGCVGNGGNPRSIQPGDEVIMPPSYTSRVDRECIRIEGSHPGVRRYPTRHDEYR
jgi:hypothetical protein